MAETHALWPDDALRASADAIAAKTAWLLADEPRWIHRRVETITFLDGTRFRRKTSVDFTLPDLPVLPHEPADVDVVPLALVRKGVLRAFDLRDEVDASVPLLTREQNTAITAAMLVQQAQETLDELGAAPLLPEVESALRAIAGETTLDSVPQPAAGSAVDEQWEALTDDGEMGGLIWLLDLDFVLFTPLQRDARRRRVLKFASEHLLEPSGGRARSRLEALGLAARRWALEVPGVGHAESYHAEVAAPDELVIERARLVDVSGHPRVLAHERGVARAHLYAGAAAPEEAGPAVLQVEFALRSALVWPVVATTAITTAILGGGLAANEWLGIGAAGEAAGLIVALPAFFAPFVAPGGHPLVRRMFSGLRALVFFSALLAFAAAATLQLDLDWREEAWLVLFALSLPPTLVALAALVRSGRAERGPSGPGVYWDA